MTPHIFANWVYWGGKLYKQHIITRSTACILHTVEPFVSEQAETLFYDGIVVILPVNWDIQYPITQQQLISIPFVKPGSQCKIIQLYPHNQGQIVIPYHCKLL